MSLSTYFLEYGRHVGQLRRRRRRRAYAPTSNTASYDNHEKFLTYMSMGLRLAALRAAGAPLLTFSTRECFITFVLIMTRLRR